LLDLPSEKVVARLYARSKQLLIRMTVALEDHLCISVVYFKLA
jgi:hypothetical protein